MKSRFEIGDECWIYLGERDERDRPRLTKGRVAHKFFCDFRVHEYYVIVLDDPDFITMEVRDIYTMTGDPDEWPSYTAFREPSAQKPRKMVS